MNTCSPQAHLRPMQPDPVPQRWEVSRRLQRLHLRLPRHIRRYLPPPSPSRHAVAFLCRCNQHTRTCVACPRTWPCRAQATGHPMQHMWTALQHVGRNHLGLWRDAYPEHQMALITSDCGAGDRCEHPAPLDLCAPNPCKHGSRCTNLYADYECECAVRRAQCRPRAASSPAFFRF